MYDHGVVEDLRAAIDGLVELDPQALGSGDDIEALHRELARLEAVVTRASAAFEAGREWEASGARSAAAWVSNHCGLADAAARRRIRLGRALRHLPVAEEAWLAGEVTDAHVAALAGARTARTEQLMARDEQVLVDQARRLRFRPFTRAVRYWSQRADPDGAEHEAEAERADRRCHVSQTFGGAVVGDFVLDRINGTIVMKQLRRIEDELFEADWAEARRRKGDEVSAADLRRTPAQRRADALVEMAIRAATAPAGGRRPEPLFSVLVGFETFAGPVCELADGTVVTPGSLVDWLDQAWVERVVFGGPSRVVDVGVRRRLFVGATRRAIEVRDRECFHPECDEVAEDCEIDHVEPWAAGGHTTVANGRVGCGFHNRRRHRRPPGPRRRE
ncbi:MAG: HNH endonuclease signature motif containing protein [Actinomycetota bacterium]